MTRCYKCGKPIRLGKDFHTVTFYKMTQGDVDETTRTICENCGVSYAYTLREWAVADLDRVVRPSSKDLRNDITRR